MRRKGYIIAAVLLVMIIVLCMKGTALSRERGIGGRAMRNRYYAAMEAEYREKMQELLEREGYHNCGINLNWTAYEDGSREYTLLLHHRKLDRLSGEERTVLQDKLAQAEFPRDAAFHTHARFRVYLQ